MKLFNLEHVPWEESQLIYHAEPLMGMECLNILAPGSPYFCIGFHQDLQKEVDLEYCMEHKIPVFRREVGGGAVYLDGDQVFFQLVLHKDNPLVQGSKEVVYERLLQPVVKTYGDLGIPTVFRPINDIVTLAGRKISGTGVASIGDYLVLVGNLIADFNYEIMTRVLKVPDEKFRDKIFKSMTENLTTIKRETGKTLTWDEMAIPLIRNFEEILGPLESIALPASVKEKMDEIKPRFESHDWLHKSSRISDGRDVKVASGVNIVQKLYKAQGGLLKASFEQKGEYLFNITLSGDFFCYPKEAVFTLERELEGKDKITVNQTLSKLYKDGILDTPGVTVDDWIRVLYG